MKTHYLCLALIILGPLSYAQDWRPIADTNNIYSYLDCERDQLFWLKADSIKQDTFFTNKVIVTVDSLTPEDLNLSCDFLPEKDQEKVVRINQANFLGHKIIDRGNGIFGLQEPTNRVLLTQAQEGDAWLFDSIANVYAGVLSVESRQIWEEIDSVKTLLLSSGDTILLSKSHGIIKYPKAYHTGCYYELIGINGKGVGRQMPNIKDFFNFEIGDKFEIYAQQESDRVAFIYSLTKQFEILGGAQFNGDTITYEVEGFEMKIDPFFEIIYIRDVSSISIYPQNSNFDLTSLSIYPSSKLSPELTQLPIGRLTNFDFWLGELKQCFKQYGGYEIDSVGNISLHLDYSSSFLEADTIDQQLAIYYQSDIDNKDRFPAFEFGSTYKEGLGRIKYYIGDLYSPYLETLVAYRKQGVTVGDFTQRPEQVSGEPEISSACVGLRIQSIHPNPIKTSINIALNRGEEIQAELIDFQGRQLSAQQLQLEEASIFIDNETYRCDVYQTSFSIPPSVPRGLYLLKVSSIQGVDTKRVFISQ